ncbi:hypothetical protein Tco_0865172 [Tanacetum coccineum]
MVGSDIDGYTARFHELARLVPHMVTPESQRGDVSMANCLTIDGIKDGIFKKKENAEDKKRSDVLSVPGQEGVHEERVRASQRREDGFGCEMRSGLVVERSFRIGERREQKEMKQIGRLRFVLGGRGEGRGGEKVRDLCVGECGFIFMDTAYVDSMDTPYWELDKRVFL